MFRKNRFLTVKLWLLLSNASIQGQFDYACKFLPFLELYYFCFFSFLKNFDFQYSNFYPEYHSFV